MNKKEAKEIEQQYGLQRDAAEEDSEEIARDQAVGQARTYPSDIQPQEFYGYKKFRADPEAKADFRGTIDKDVVFANIGGPKPDLGELNFRHGTAILFRETFLGEDEDVEDIKAFMPVFEYVLGEYKFMLTGSRAQGPDREAVLDNQTSIKKEISRKKEASGKLGFGGG